MFTGLQAMQILVTFHKYIRESAYDKLSWQSNFKLRGDDLQIWNQTRHERRLGGTELSWPAAWGRAVSGRRWKGFPWATTPGRAARPLPWRCRWRRWSWPASRRTAPACGARPGGCHSPTWTWTCSAATDGAWRGERGEDVKRQTFNQRDKWLVRRRGETGVSVSLCSTHKMESA